MTDQVTDFRARAKAMMNPGQADNASGNQTKPADQRPKEEFWMNVGLRMDMPDPTNPGETIEVFCPLAVGIPFGQMKARTVRGNDLLNNQTAEVGEMLRVQYQEAMMKLAHGESMAVDLDVEIRRVKKQGVEGTAAAGYENPLLVQARERIAG